jgi:SAM-dependent methyltransferase
MTDSEEKLGSPGSYILGHSGHELGRLSAQSRLLNPITRRFLLEAGILAGMRVLDVGTGVGDVAFLAEEIVGEAGEVIGVDREQAALDVARGKADSTTRRNISFCAGDPSKMVFEQPFDAIIGRYVLLFQHDSAQMLRQLATQLKPEGLIVFHEPSLDARSFPPSPTWDQCCQWVVETLRLDGTETNMGIKLYPTFLAAGLPPPEVRVEAILRGGANSDDLVNWIVGLIGTILPSMERLGIVAAHRCRP